ncbi:MAG: AAA family ATPase [Methanomassiliicoccales archaeon]
MSTLFLGSVTERSGKSMVSLGLALNHSRKVGYFKPFRETLRNDRERLVDQDAYLMKRALRLDVEEEKLSPFTYDIHRPLDIERIVRAYQEVKGSCEDMLVEGTRDVLTGFLHNVSGLTIAEAIGAEVVLISSKQTGSFDKLAMLVQLMRSYKVRFKGAILNFGCGDEERKLLERRGIRVLGSIPEAPELRHFRVREVVEALRAEVVVEEGLDNRVEEVMIGAMSPETAIRFMRRASHKALITCGDRSDLHMAALSTDTSCLILTGGLYPEKQVVAKAYERRVPILLTSLDTMSAAEAVDHLIARIDPEDQVKIDRIRGLVKENVDIQAIWS